MEEVELRAGGTCYCPCCHQETTAQYEAQDPAPCGCRWLWEGSPAGGHAVLVAAPSLNDWRG